MVKAAGLELGNLSIISLTSYRFSEQFIVSYKT